MLRTFVALALTILATTAPAVAHEGEETETAPYEPQGPPTGWYVRGGGAAEVGRGGIGPAASFEVIHMDEARVLGLRADAAYRNALIVQGADASLQAEFGRAVPVGRWSAQGTLTGGATVSYVDDWGFGSWDGSGATYSPEVVLAPEVGASLGLVNPTGKVWVGLRGRAVSQAVGLGVTVGHPVGR